MGDEHTSETDTQDEVEKTESGQGGARAGKTDELATLQAEVKKLQAAHEKLQSELEAREKRIKELNSESAGRRVENKTLQETLEEIKTALEAERKQREDAEKAAQDAAKQAERTKVIGELAAKYKLPAKVAERLTGETPDELEADAKALADELGPARTKGGKTGSTGNSAWTGGLTLEAIADMSPDEINEHWDEVSKLLSAGS